MIIKSTKQQTEKSSVIAAITDGKTETLPPQLREMAEILFENKSLIENQEGSYQIQTVEQGKIVHCVFLNLTSDKKYNVRQLFLLFAAAFKTMKRQKVKSISVLLDGIGDILTEDMISKLLEIPVLVSYEFCKYKSDCSDGGFQQVEFVLQRGISDDMVQEAISVAESTTLARDFVNRPSNDMTAQQFAEETQKLGQQYGIEVSVYHEDKIRELGMGCFYNVAKGSREKPELIVMKYRGNPNCEKTIGLIGKGVMFDSGGYNLKSKMDTMHDDMGGAAAVVAATVAAARNRLPVNVTAVIAACKNMISDTAQVPGDIVRSMSGKTVEMLNTDAEGRLTLIDAITYAVREEKVDVIIDIATLTGAAKGAVGNRCSAVLSNDEDWYCLLKKSSEESAEKIWRLDLDDELRSCLNSPVADIRNVNAGGTQGAGTGIAAMFIEAFTEGKPFVHIDMAPVNWLLEENSYCARGGTGYGSALLYRVLKNAR